MKNKYVAALLAFFLGGIGIHKFYLGRTGAGILYALFFWTFIPGMIAFFESIILLFMPDSEFNFKFNGQFIAPSLSSGNPIQEALALEKLAELQAKGLITENEFEAKRRQILDRM
jgi:TM2 domain-containing membrane protein YozV